MAKYPNFISHYATPKLGIFFSQFDTLKFNQRSAQLAGQIRAALAAKGMLIGSNDLLIAAVAIANNLTLVTHNIWEFSRIQGLEYEDWE